MKLKLFFLLSSLVISLATVVLVWQGNFTKPQEARAQTTLNFYVATDGNDVNPGTLAQPFLTLEKARNAIREAKYGVPQRYGSIVGATWSNSGKAGNCLSLGGSGYVDSKNGLSYDGAHFLNPDDANNSALDITGDLTLSIWVKVAGGAAGGFIARWGGKDSKGYGLAMYSSKFEFIVGGGTSLEAKAIVSNSTYGVDGLWHHIVGVRTGGAMRLYIDNILQTSQQSTSDLSVATLNKLYLGAFTNDGTYPYYFNGLLDEARIYNRALSVAEIDDLFNLREPSTTGLVRRHTFNEGAGILTKDVSQGDAVNSVTPVRATVWIRGGTYQLTQSLVLDSEDSGTIDAPITYQNYNNEEVHIIGGKKLTTANWKIVQPGAIKDRLRTPAKSAVYQIDLKNSEGITDYGSMATRPMQLFFDGSPMTLARYPNTGWLIYNTGDNAPPRFTYTGKHVDLDWQIAGRVTDTWVYGFYANGYFAGHNAISSVDVAIDTVYLASAPQYGLVDSHRFRYDNVLEELNSAGEYWIDRSTGILYFWPPSDINASEAYVSLLETPLITMNNVNYLTIRGLTLEDTRGQAIKADTCDHVLLDACTIRNIGTSYSITFVLSSYSGVTNCVIYNLTDGAIWMQGGTAKYVKNNTIHDLGQWNMTNTAAVYIDGTGGIVSHNLIYNLPHLAIGVHGNNNIIEFNEIHDVCLQTSDAGAIYSGAVKTETGNIIRYNYFHDIDDIGSQGIYGVYFDDWEAGFETYGNIFDNVETGIFAHFGSNHTIANNVFVNSGTMDILINSATPPPTGNKILSNIHYAPITNAPSIHAEGEVGLVNNWTRSDPLFVDYANKNFQMADNSPVWAMGFQRIPIGDIGIGSTAVGTAMDFSNLPPMPTYSKGTLKSGLANGLQLYLALNAYYGQDIALDSSGNGHHGTITNNVNWLGVSGGKLGNGLSFAGTVLYDRIVIPDSDSLSFVTGGMSISVWVKRDNNSRYEYIVSKDKNGYEYQLWFSSGSLVLSLYDNNENVVISRNAPYFDAGVWHHIVATYDGGVLSSGIKIYVDGNRVDTGSYQAGTFVAMENTTSPVIIGDGFDGSIDEAMIWNRVLTSDEITALHNLDIYESAPSQLTPNITLTKSADKTQASQGEEITYTIAYQNIGTAEANNAVITDVIPTGATYVANSASNGGVLGTGGTTLTWTITSVPAGGSGSVSFKVKVN